MDTFDILKKILAGNATGSPRIQEAQTRQGGGGLGDILGSMLGRGGSQAPQQQQQRPESMDPGDLGGMLEDLLGVGGRKSNAAPPQRQPQPVPAPAPRRQPRREPENDSAAILIRAMCNAAKVDGNIDKGEQEAILSRLGDVSDAELNFVRQELQAPLDIEDFCDSVPSQLAQQVYAFSVLAIKLDTLTEAAYLGRLGSGLELDPETCNEIHKQVQAPCIYVIS